MKMIKKYRNLDFKAKTYLTSSLSLLLTIIFSLFNLISFIINKTYYSLAIFIYYFLLTIFRFIILNHLFNNKDNTINLFKRTKILLLILNFFILIPIVLMILDKRTVNIDCKYLAIILAIYTTIRITLSIINLIKTKNTNNILIKELRQINLIDSLLAFLVLENTMLYVFKDNNEIFLHLRIYSSFIIYLLIITTEIISVIKSNKIIKNELLEKN